MINKNKDFELLSAYIDNELSFEEKDQLKVKIKSSLQLQKKLEDLKKIKTLTSSAYKKLPESPYFESKLFALLAVRDQWYKKVIKWLPAIGFTSAAIIIMVVLQSNPDIFKNLIEQQKSNITGFYKENLQPLLFAADINKEDIFNFAMYKQLPLNRDDKQILQIGYDESGKEFFEIKNIKENHDENNFEKFVIALDLDEKEKKQIDSIMNQYAKELEAQILINNNSTVAINSNLWNYQRAIQTDLLVFAEESNWKEFQKFVPKAISYTHNRDVAVVVNEMRNSTSENYIFLTPDSIFSEHLEYDHDKFKIQLAKLEKELNKKKNNLKEIHFQFDYDSSLQKLNNNLHNNFKISFDSNLCRVELSEFNLPEMNFQDFDTMFIALDSVAHNFRYYSQFIPKVEYIDNKILFHFEGDSAKTYEFEYYKFDLDSLIEFQIGKLDSLKNSSWNNFYQFNDSLLFNGIPKLESYFKFYDGDVEIHLEMQKLRVKLDSFKEEMKQWREEFSRDFQHQNKHKYKPG